MEDGEVSYAEQDDVVIGNLYIVGMFDEEMTALIQINDEMKFINKENAIEIIAYLRSIFYIND